MIAVLGLGAGVRLVNLSAWPVFVDEGTHLAWARAWQAGAYNYPLWMDGRVGLIVALGLWPLDSPAPLWLARVALALASLLGLAGVMALGRAGREPRAGVWAGACLAVLPLAVFHDRQALGDTLSVALGWLGLAVAARLWARPAPLARPFTAPRGLMLALTAALLAASVLSKFNHVVLLAGVGLGALLWPGSASGRRRAVWESLGVLALAGALSMGALAALGPAAGQANSIFANASLSFLTCPPVLCQGDWAAQAARWPLVWPSVAALFDPYLGGWVALSVAALAVLRPGQRRWAMWAWLTAGVAGLAVLLAGAGPLPTRYFLLWAGCWAWLVGLGLARSDALPRPARWLAPAVAVLALTWGWRNTLPMLVAPAQATLSPVDAYQYRTGPYAGAGFADAAQVIGQAEASARPLVLAREWRVLSAGAYLNHNQVEVVNPLDLTWQAGLAALAANRPVYVLDDVAATEPVSTPFSLGQWPRTLTHTLHLQGWRGDTPATREALLAALFPRPEGYLDVADALLTAPGAPHTLVGWPPAWGRFLAERRPLYPASPAQVRLDVALTVPLADLPDTQPLVVAFLDETRFDSAHALEYALAGTWHRTGQTWQGAVRVVTYAPPAPAARRLTPNMEFGDGLWLTEAERAEMTTVPGGWVRLRLHWRLDRPTDRVLKTFTHIYRGETLVAQFDAYPLGEAWLTSTWPAGARHTDAYAVTLPNDLPTGDYIVKLGVYDAFSLERIPTATGADMVDLGALTVTLPQP